MKDIIIPLVITLLTVVNVIILIINIKHIKNTRSVKNKMQPVIRQIKDEEVAVLDLENKNLALDKFKAILSQFLNEYYNKVKPITYKKKLDIKLKTLPLIHTLYTGNLKLNITDKTQKEKLEKLKQDYNALTEESSSINLVIEDLLDVII